MGGIKLPKKISVDANTFYRFFRKTIRDPLIDEAIKKLNVSKHITVDKVINETLPEKLMEKIIKSENATGFNGVQKKAMVEQYLWQVLKDIGLDILFPLFAQKLPSLIIFLYKEYYLEKFKAWGLEHYIEIIVNVDLDEDGSIGEHTTTPTSTLKTLDFGIDK